MMKRLPKDRLFVLMFGLVSIVAMAQTRSKPIVFTHATVVVLNGRYLSKESMEKMLADVEAAADKK
jgi:hypothetical protein